METQGGREDLAACARPQGRHEGVPELGGTSVIKGESGWHWTSTEALGRSLDPILGLCMEA